MASPNCDSHCKLCTKELDRVTSDSACVVCEAEHTSWVHQRCFDKAIDKAIRVRSSKSTSFENIARSPTRFFKTQKCPEPNCIKWLAEYTPESATDPTAVTDKPEGLKVSLKSVIAQYEENEAEEDEDSTQCSATKVDGTRCNFTISDQTFRLCRRCSEKATKQRVVTESLQSDNSEESKSTESSRKAKLEKEKDKEKKKSKSSKGQGLNSMLKSLAKPPPPPLSLKDKKLLIEKASPAACSTNAPPGIFTPSFGSETSSPTSDVAPSDKFYPPGFVTSNGEVYEVPEITPQSDASLPIVPPSSVSNESELINSVRYFIDVHSEGGRTTPREIARYLGTLRGGGGGGGTAIEVMRARFHKLRNLVEAFPKLFQLHEPSRIELGGPEYEVTLAPPQLQKGTPSRVLSRTPSPIAPLSSNNLYEWKGDNTVVEPKDMLSLMVPPNAKIPISVDHVLEFLDLKQFDNLFREQEFLPYDLFLVTDDDLKDIGIPPGPLVKLRNWVISQTFAA